MLKKQAKSMGWATRGEGAEDEETDEGRCVSGTAPPAPLSLLELSVLELGSFLLSPLVLL
jgi:hypothetical protein